MRVAYASQTLALAAMEYFVNLNPEDAPDDLVSVRVEIPEAVRIEEIDLESLPSDWRAMPYPAELQSIGELWIGRGSSVCLVVVPSAVIPAERNLLISPGHLDFRELRVSEPLEFRFRSTDVEVTRTRNGADSPSPGLI